MDPPSRGGSMSRAAFVELIGRSNQLALYLLTALSWCAAAPGWRVASLLHKQVAAPVPASSPQAGQHLANCIISLFAQPSIY